MAVYSSALSNPIFSTISKVADDLQLETYVIGGFVRDFFLNREKKKDIDIVCVGSGIELANAVAEELGLSKKNVNI